MTTTKPPRISALRMFLTSPNPSAINPEIKTEIQDDRTPEQKDTHKRAVVAYDRSMSNWGGAQGGMSYCAWAMHPDVSEDTVFAWVRSRSDMSHVNVVDLDFYSIPSGTAHFHIYVCNPDHVAANH